MAEDKNDIGFLAHYTVSLLLYTLSQPQVYWRQADAC